MEILVLTLKFTQWTKYDIYMLKKFQCLHLRIFRPEILNKILWLYNGYYTRLSRGWPGFDSLSERISHSIMTTSGWYLFFWIFWIGQEKKSNIYGKTIFFLIFESMVLFWTIGDVIVNDKININLCHWNSCF